MNGPTLARLLIALALAASCDGTSPEGRTLSAADFTVAVVSGSDEETPGLVAAREAGVATLRRDLPSAWTAATRGLGKLTVVSENPGIVMTVLAASGSSFHRGPPRSSEASITIYVADTKGRLEGIDLVPTAIHELGHIWCCYGPGSSADGHWATAQDDGREFGYNRWGLMNHPVLCKTTSNGSKCADRFSDRELSELGFASFPAATPNPCVAHVDRLKASLKSVEATLLSDQKAKDELRAEVERLRPTLDPRDPAQIARFNALVVQANAALAAYNRDVDTFNTLQAQYRPVWDDCVTDPLWP